MAGKVAKSRQGVEVGDGGFAPSAVRAVQDQARDVQEPARVVQQCAGICHRRQDPSAVRGLREREGHGRGRARSVRGSDCGLDRELVPLRSDQRRRGRGDSAVSTHGGGDPPLWRGLHGAAHPWRQARALGRRPLAAGIRPVGSARADPPLLSGRDGGPRCPPHPRRLRGGGPAGLRGRPRRGGDLDAGGHADRAVLVARHEPPQRRLRRGARQSHALQARDSRGPAARRSARSS